ncbi:MAG: DNA replication and repair protein RecF [bacterium]|nr:DNA replication and repair protein RecF [bacterium]MDT8395593.1 DNA replication and repair protein RecF [bacterium]
MRLLWVEPDRFRNLDRKTVELHPRFNLLLGRNGQGKTNFLEAVGYLGSLRSFRSGGRVEMIRHGESAGRVTGAVSSGGLDRVLSFTLTGRGRQQYIDDQKVNSPEQYLQVLKVVHFIPEDVSLVGGSPSWRRKVIDRAVFEIVPEYAREYRRYLSALRQRNALLRRGGGRFGELEGWNKALAAAGAVLVCRRMELLHTLNPRMKHLGERLGLGPGLGLEYTPGFTVPDDAWPGGPGKLTQLIGTIENSILEELARVRTRESRLGHSLAGPHRDNIQFTLGSPDHPTDLARYGSQGQKRSAVLAFKLALAAAFRDTHGAWPLILLDDVASELDETRRKALGSLVVDMKAQFLISTTGEEYMFLPSGEGKIWTVDQGELKPFGRS